jgi:hypothetical protein
LIGDIRHALQLQQEGPHQQQEGDEAGHRVARQADEVRLPHAPIGKGLAGLDGDLPQVQRAERCTAGLMWSSSPTDTPPLVRIRSWVGGASRSASTVRRAVGHDAQVRDLAAQPQQQARRKKRLEL